MLFAVIILSAN